MASVAPANEICSVKKGNSGLSCSFSSVLLINSMQLIWTWSVTNQLCSINSSEERKSLIIWLHFKRISFQENDTAESCQVFPSDAYRTRLRGNSECGVILPLLLNNSLNFLDVQNYINESAQALEHVNLTAIFYPSIPILIQLILCCIVTSLFRTSLYQSSLIYFPTVWAW